MLDNVIGNRGEFFRQPNEKLNQTHDLFPFAHTLNTFKNLTSESARLRALSKGLANEATVDAKLSSGEKSWMEEKKKIRAEER